MSGNVIDYKFKEEFFKSKLLFAMKNELAIFQTSLLHTDINLISVSKKDIEKENIPGIAFTDGEKIYICVTEETADAPTIMYIIMHELSHIFMDHCKRKMSDYDMTLWNLAADHVTNRLINSVCQIIPQFKDFDYDKYYFNKELHKTHPTCSAEFAYDYIKKDFDNTYKIQKYILHNNKFEEQKEKKYTSKGNNPKEDKSGESDSKTNRKGNEKSQSDGDDQSPSSAKSKNKSSEADKKSGQSSQSKSNQQNGESSSSGSGQSSQSKSNQQNGESSSSGSGQSSQSKSGQSSEQSNQSDPNSQPDNSNENKLNEEEQELKDLEKAFADMEGATIYKVTNKKTGQHHWVFGDTNIEGTPSKLPKNIQEQKIENIKNNAKMNWYATERQKLRGNTTGNMFEELDRLFEIKIPVERLIENSIKHPIQTEGKKSKWTIPNKITRHLNVRLKGHCGDFCNMILVAGLDTSGSITNKELKIFFSALKNTSQLFKKVIIYLHDTDVKDVYEFTGTVDEKTIIDYIKQKGGIAGRGGTSHKDLFDKIEKLCEDELVSSVIFLTDYFSDVEKHYKKYDFFEEHETLWLITNNPTLKGVNLNGCDTKTFHLNA